MCRKIQDEIFCLNQNGIEVTCIYRHLETTLKETNWAEVSIFTVYDLPQIFSNQIARKTLVEYVYLRIDQIEINRVKA